MKKLVLAAGAILMLTIVACSGSDTQKPEVKPDQSSTATTCNIRYIDVDSVLSAYVLAQELFAEQQKEVNSLESAARQKESELQRLQSNIESKARNNGYLSEQSFNADVAGLQQRQDEVNQWLNTHQDRIARLMVAQRQRLDDSLQNFLKAFNDVYQYDAILDKKAGVFKPELDVTAEVIQGLNERYVSDQSKK